MKEMKNIAGSCAEGILRKESNGPTGEVGSRKSEVGRPKWEAGTRKSEAGSQKSEAGSQKSEVGCQAQTGPAVPIAIGNNRGLYFVCPATAACTEKENMEYRISLPRCLAENNEYRISNNESGRKNPVQASSIPEGLHVYRNAVSRGNSTPAGVVQSDASWYFYKHLIPLESGKVHTRHLTGNETSTSFLSPSPFGEGRGEAYAESGRNIPVRCTSGVNTFFSATNITGALHLGFQTACTAIGEPATEPRNTLPNNQQVCRTAIGETAAEPRNALPNIRLFCQTFISETAAAPRNICSNECNPFEIKVQSTETLNGNIEYRISLPRFLAGNVESGKSGKAESEPETRNFEPETRNFEPETRNFEAETRNFEPETRNFEPGTRNFEAETRNFEAETRNFEAETRNFEPGTRNFEPGTLNPEPGTLNINPETLNQKTEQPGHTMTSSHSMTAKYKDAPHLPRGGFYSGDCPGAAAITIIYSLFSSPRVSPTFAGTTQKNLPVPDSYRDNRPETNGFPWYCYPVGRYSGLGTSPHPESPQQRTKPERRYAYVLN